MRLTIPISASDAHLLPDFTAAIQKYGPYFDHHCLIAPAPSQVDVGNQLKDALTGHFASVECIPVERDHFEYPAGPNMHFAQVVTEIIAPKHRAGDALPWFWMELDCFPRAPQWLDRLANGFQSAGVNVAGMGKVKPYFVKHPVTGKPMQMDPRDDFMLGCAVYSSGIGCDQRFITELVTMLGGTKDGIPFDVALRHNFKQAGRCASDLIEDKWNTVNYRIEDGVLVCDVGAPRADVPNGIPRDGPIHPSAVVIHGCKDGSGHRLAAAGEIPEPQFIFQAPPRTQGVALPMQTPNAASASPDLMQLMAMMIQGQQQTNQLLQKMAGNGNGITHTPEYQRAFGPEPSQAGSPGASSPSGPTGSVSVERPMTESDLNKVVKEEQAEAMRAFNASAAVEKIVNFMAGGAKTLKAISEHVGLSQDEVQQIAMDNPHRLCVSARGLVKWIQLAAATAGV